MKYLKILRNFKKKKKVLAQLKETNKKLNRTERMDVFEKVKTLITKNIFNHMVNGTYVSDSNLAIAEKVLSRMSEVVKVKEALTAMI
jgi:hypothetical protein